MRQTNIVLVLKISFTQVLDLKVQGVKSSIRILFFSPTSWSERPNKWVLASLGISTLCLSCYLILFSGVGDVWFSCVYLGGSEIVLQHLVPSLTCWECVIQPYCSFKRIIQVSKVWTKPNGGRFFSVMLAWKESHRRSLDKQYSSSYFITKSSWFWDRIWPHCV